VSRDKLFDVLLAGDGDIAVGDIAITDERRKKSGRFDGGARNVREIVVTGEDVPEPDGAERSHDPSSQGSCL